jgi:ligand-binding sensor domain-containing protein
VHSRHSSVPIYLISRIIASLLLLLVLSLPAHAHNGAVAIAVPLEGIAIDGELDDWPEGMKRYPIRLTRAGPGPVDAADYQAAFRVGYHALENVLYLAVEVEDESTVIDTTTGAQWEPQDGLDIFIKGQHTIGNEARAHQYVLWGYTRREYGGAKRSDAEVGFRHEEGRHRYEWRIDMGRATGERKNPGSNLVVSLDVAIWDKDEDGSASFITWGREGGGEHQGDLVLVGRDAGIGKVQGRLVWEEGEEGISRGKVGFQSLDTEGLLVQVETDQEGRYVVDLPEGDYRIETTDIGTSPGESPVVEVRRGEGQTVTLAVPSPTGLTKTAGKGIKTRIGAGFRQGQWQTFGVRDGLPASSISSIYRDRNDYLWFATRGGVSRYDGVSFFTLTVEDGLPRRTTSILEDRQGNLWFGTWEGVSRYDGTRFTTFTVADGLGSNRVNSILQDREGVLWLATYGGGVSRYDGVQFETFTIEDGLGSNTVAFVLEDRQGHIWIGTLGGGVSRYDGAQFETFTAKDGLNSNTVACIAEDGEGNLWFSTVSGNAADEARGKMVFSGIYGFDGKRFFSAPFTDGLGNHIVNSILEDRQGNLWFATDGGGVSRYDGTHITTFTTEDGLANDNVLSILEDGEGYLWVGTSSGVSRYDGEHIRAYTTADGLGNHNIGPILEDKAGNLWFSTRDGGVSRYDGAAFTSFNTENGLAHNTVLAMLEDSRGNIWFGAKSGGVTRYNGEDFQIFTSVEDGLTNDQTRMIKEDRKGNLWFIPEDGGVSRYDGERFTTFTSEDGLGHDMVQSMLEDREGNLWFGTREGATRYDGKSFATFSEEDGLPYGVVGSIFQDREGNLWFTTWEWENADATGSITLYDGESFKTFTSEDGLIEGPAWSLMEDRKGNIWFGIWEDGLARYDGESFKTFRTADGLVSDELHSMMEDREGILWFATADGISRYDGFVFQDLLRRDGLVHRNVHEMHQDRNGDIWITTAGGITRYRPKHTPPIAHLGNVVADRRYDSNEEIRLPSSQRSVIFEFQGQSFSTRPDQMVYVYRLQGYEEEWQQTRESQVEYADLPTGTYTFQLKAVDRDLNYSEPATARITIHPPYVQLALRGGLGLALVGLVLVGGYALKKRRDLFAEMEEELQIAHDLQMGLMPEASPQIPGFDVTGRCIPYNHVGGDLFQYFQQEGKLSICMADVTGHAMEAAVPAMLFAGVLETEMQYGHPLERLFGHLNHTLHQKLDNRTFVCFTLGEIDLTTRNLRLANGGCPYPYHFHAATGEVEELQVDAYPLGIRGESRYDVVERTLATGDRIVFCSDGIIEAANLQGEFFGFERTAEKIRRGCQEGLAAEALIDQLIGAVETFAGGAPQGDDRTVVVLQVGERE